MKILFSLNPQPSASSVASCLQSARTGLWRWLPLFWLCRCPPGASSSLFPCPQSSIRSRLSVRGKGRLRFLSFALFISYISIFLRFFWEIQSGLCRCWTDSSQSWWLWSVCRCRMPRCTLRPRCWRNPNFRQSPTPHRNLNINPFYTFWQKIHSWSSSPLPRSPVRKSSILFLPRSTVLHIQQIEK